MAQPWFGDPVFQTSQAKILRDRVKWFRTYAAARAYYDKLRGKGASPAMFAMASDTRPWSTQDYEQIYPQVSVPPTGSLLPGELPWMAVPPPAQNFDFVLFANINTGDSLLMFGRKPHLIDANHAGEGMQVICTPAGQWGDGRHVIWAVMKDPDDVDRAYDVTFDLPKVPWRPGAKPPEWGPDDYSTGETPPFRTQ